MNKSDSIAALAAALAKAQGQMTHASKDATNPHFRSKYADLAAVVEAIRVPMSDNGLSFTQLCDFTESGGLIIETVLMHSSGEWISGRLAMPVPKMDPQGVGSAITYGKRYALAAIVGIAADEDDDGEAAMGRSQSQGKATLSPAPQSGTQAKLSAIQTKLFPQVKAHLDALFGDDVAAKKKECHAIAGVEDYRKLDGDALKDLEHKLRMTVETDKDMPL